MNINPNLTSVVEIITPEKAQEYLTHNTANYRALSSSTVENYAKDMKNGTFRTNGEAIQFSANGTLKNGQHRLHAIVKSGIPQQMVVVRGVADDIDEYDWGRNRNLKQWGKANGMDLRSAIPCTARIMVGGFSGKIGKGTVTQYIEEHLKELQEAYSISTTGKRDGYGNRGGVCLAVYINRKYCMTDDDVMKKFFYIFNTGTVQKDVAINPNPAMVAARVFSKLPKGGSHAQQKQYEIVMLALNDFKKNKDRIKDYITGTDLSANYLKLVQGIAPIKEVM